jgi:hypothetical protein
MDMDHSQEQTRTIVVASPPQRLYDMVSDVTRMGHWSPVTTACRWEEGDGEEAGGPKAGATFVGHNENEQRTWETRCRVVTAEPGAEFAFEVVGAADGEPLAEGVTRWGYRFTAVADGTEVEESWRLLPSGLAQFHALPEEQRRMVTANILGGTVTGMEQTLANLKRVAETG